jgi:hypothetical protein
MYKFPTIFLIRKIMPFVNETIAEADKAKYEAYGFKSPFRNEFVAPKKWVIDRERDVFLICLGGQGRERSEIPLIFVLVWKGEIIRFDTFYKGHGDPQAGQEFWWNVLDIVIPSLLKSKKTEIFQLIREALTEYGDGIDSKYVKATHIGISPETAF